MIFVPTTLPKDHEYPLDQLRDTFKKEISEDISLEEIFIIDKNKKELSAIWFSNPKTDKVILYAHGNAGCIGTRFPFLHAFAPLCSILLFDYRGYGKSIGVPSEKVLYEDILTAYEHLLHDRKFDPNDIIVYGESLGCAPTAWLGNYLKDTTYKPRGLILQCGFSNINNIACDLMGRFIWPLISTKLDNMKQVQSIGDKIKILVAHSKKDELIHYYHSELLVRSNPFVFHYELKGSHSGPDNFTEHYLDVVKEMFIN